MQLPFYVLNGPNLNLLGKREPAIYGHATLADVEAEVRAQAAKSARPIEFRQTNAEGELIDWIHESREHAAGIIINPAGWSHTSVALADALATVEVPIIEVHISNIHRREPFRHHSYVSAIASAVIAGCGTHGYVIALVHLERLLQST